jgi:formylglycine-generating enzyme required for sulfatase activity
VPAPTTNGGPPLDWHAWRDGRPPPELLQHPVVLVWYEEARTYCKSLGKRLPSEAEWEAAARGPEGRRFAWGDAFDPAICNTAEAGLHRSLPVGSFPANASPFGALDLGCNVSEWTGGRYAAYPRVRHVDNRYEWEEFYEGYYAATHGASYETLSWRARASYRGIEEATSRSDDYRTRKLVGFRCAVDVPEGSP